MAKGNNALLIFDFDNTITNGHMHSYFRSKWKSDLNSTIETAVTDADIRNFLENTDGIKNEGGLQSVLQSALSSGMEVNIASYTKYPNAVKRVVENHLGLSKEQAESVSVFGRYPEDYDNKLKGDKEQQDKVGKNLHTCKAIVEYKNKHGQLPKTVMLVDDDGKNIDKFNKFVESMNGREGWLKENGLSIEEVQKIKFEGVQVPKESKNVDYLGKVQKFINTSLIQEPIYKNLRKEDPIYQNLQDIQNALKVQAEPVRQNVSSSLPQKRKSDSDIAVDGENKKQDIKPSETRVKPTRSRRHAMILDPAQIGSIHQSTEELSPGKKHAHTQTFSLFREIKSIKQWFTGCAKEIIDTVCNLFKKEVVTKLKEQGYAVSSEQGNDGIIVSSNELIYASKINKDIIVESLKQVMENKEKIQDLEKLHKGNQLEREISKLLNADLQKKNISPNSVGVNYDEPIFQTREEALRGDSQKKNANLSRRPLPPLPPKSRMEEMRAEGKTKTIEKS